jgi:hypothetical protein
VSGGEGEGGTAPPRLLLDQNLAPALARRLADLYPDSAHVREFGLATADDEAVWAQRCASRLSARATARRAAR